MPANTTPPPANPEAHKGTDLLTLPEAFQVTYHGRDITVCPVPPEGKNLTPANCACIVHESTEEYLVAPQVQSVRYTALRTDTLPASLLHTILPTEYESMSARWYMQGCAY